jgi:acetoacetate decarboxylase
VVLWGFQRKIAWIEDEHSKESILGTMGYGELDFKSRFPTEGGCSNRKNLVVLGY